MDKWFKGFFRFSEDGIKVDGTGLPSQEEGDDGFENFNMNPDHGHQHGIDDMCHHFDNMFRSFEEMFKNIGTAEFPNQSEGDKSHDPRDRMLKEPDDKPIPEYSPVPQETPFGNWFGMKQPRTSVEQRIDSDLDSRKGIPELDSLFKPHLERNEQKPLDVLIPYHREPSSSFTSRSVSVRKVVTPDGKVEEHRTVRDSSGREETTVTRRLGDQSYSVTTKKDSSGTTEILEHYNNMEEGAKYSFDQDWHSSSLYNQPSSKSETPDREHDGFLRSLFKFSFPGFGK